jgi:hypothetical protein
MPTGLQGLYGGFSSPQFSIPNPLEENLKSWEDARAELGKRAARFDPTARAQFNDLNAKTDAVQKAYRENRLTRDEYLQAVSGIKDNAEDFRWQSHDLGEGAVPGDIIEVNGVQKLRDQNGLTPIGFTPDYIRQNTVPIGDSGQIAIPIGPGKPYMVVKREQAERNAAEERTGIEEMRLQIAEQYDKMVQRELNTRAGQPISEQEMYELATSAGEIVTQRYEQAKSLYTRIMDSGVDDRQRAVRGESPNPYAEKVRAALAPEPSMSPAIPQQQPQQMPALPTTGPQMLAGAPSGGTLQVANKEEMLAAASEAPDGTIFALPDGRLYQQEGGRPMQLAGNVPLQRGTSGMLTYAGIPEEEQLAMMQGQLMETTPQLAPEPGMDLTERESIEMLRQGELNARSSEANKTKVFNNIIGRMLANGDELTEENVKLAMQIANDAVGSQAEEQAPPEDQTQVSPEIQQELDTRLGALQSLENQLARLEGRRPKAMHKLYGMKKPITTGVVGVAEGNAAEAEAVSPAAAKEVTRQPKKEKRIAAPEQRIQDRSTPIATTGMNAASPRRDAYGIQGQSGAELARNLPGPQSRADFNPNLNDQIFEQAAKTMSRDPWGQENIAGAKPLRTDRDKQSEIAAGSLVRLPDGQVYMKLNNGKFVLVE